MEKSSNSSYDRNMEDIKHALYSVNRHAKTAIDKRELYELKYKTLQKLIKIGHAQKVRLEYSPRPGASQQSTVVLVKVGIKSKGQPVYFHMLPEKDDFKSLKHTGATISQDAHNPKSTMPLNIAKTLLQKFIGVTSKKVNPQKTPRPALNKKIFSSSFLDGSSKFK